MYPHGHPLHDDDGYRYARFADPYGTSALHAGVRDQPCPTCKEPDVLTAADRRAGYQCDRCADRAEGFGD